MDKYAHFIDTGIREQHAIAMAHGISVENPDSRIYVCY
jgi:deoxyxylulose-5-phosphate synthase